MGATSDNYDIVTSGTTYTIASTFVNDAHHQRVQIGYGQTGSFSEITASTGLPVELVGTTLSVTINGALARYDYFSETGFNSIATSLVGNSGVTFGIAGIPGGAAVGITVGTLTVAASAFDIRKLYGGAVGATSGSTSGIDYIGVQGIANAYPVGITVSSAVPVSVSSFANLGIYGISGGTAINVQATNLSIRGLTAASDTITVYGGGTASSVSVGLFGFTGTNTSPIYAESNALNVNVKTSTGITVSASDLDIRDLSYTSDTVTVVGQGATDTNSLSTIPTYINAQLPNGTLSRVGGITGSGWSGSALNVNLINNGITFSVVANATFSAEVGITASAAGAIPVQGSLFAARGVWVTGSTSGDPVTVRGASGGLLPVEVSGFSTQTGNITTAIGQVKTNTDFMAAMKKALYSSNVSVGAFDFRDKDSIYTLIQNEVAAPIQGLQRTILGNGAYPTTQDSLNVTLVGSKQQPKFMARTGNATYSPQNLTAFNAAGGYTCANGVRIKASRIASGTGGSQNQIMCVISEADAAVYGATAGAASYVLYHGDEMFFEVDNINKIKVFYPAYSASFAPHNTGNNMTFSFYAS
jgi:hypothetical protein